MTEYTSESLQSPIVRQEFAARIKSMLDKHIEEKYTRKEKSRRMGASELAHECAAYLWYKFRWAGEEKIDARQLRLFDRGNREEARFIEWLRGIGFEVWNIDPNAGDMRLNKQFRLRACRGHVGGFLDSIGMHALCDVKLLFEYKTFATKTFGELLTKGVALHRPQHYGQMCIYGKEYGFKYALYFAINKNDDDWHVECVELNEDQAKHLLFRAEAIINSPHRPERISETPTYWKCKGCEFTGVCHGVEKMPINCRTCQHSKPIDNSDWFCSQWQQAIPYDFVPKGCELHRPIK